MSLESITKNTAALIVQIRQYARDQATLWNQVPYLALEADGRSGYSDTYARAYRYGFWALDPSVQNGSYTVYVDLENGELLLPVDTRRTAHDRDVLTLARSPDCLDAKAILAELREQARADHWEHYDPREQRAWRRSLRKEYQLHPKKYTRKIAKGPASFAMD